MNKKLELIRLSDELCDKIDSDYQKLIKSDVSLKEISRKISNHLKEYNQQKDDLLIFYKVNNLVGEIYIDKLFQDINSHESKLLLLSSQIEEILKAGKCYQCKGKLSKIL